MKLTPSTGRLVAAAVLTGTMLVGGGVVASPAQAATLGTVQFLWSNHNGTWDAGEWQRAWDYCRKLYPETRSVRKFRNDWANDTTSGGVRTITFLMYYQCNSTR